MKRGKIMSDLKNIDGKTRFGQVRELYNQEHKRGEQVTLEKLGEMCHTSPATFSRIEKGETDPSIDVIKTYSELFGVTTAYLMGVDETDAIKETAAIKKLGLTDTTGNTLRNISAMSTDKNDLMALVNAFLGNGELTLGFFQNLLFYIEDENMDIEGDILFLWIKGLHQGDCQASTSEDFGEKQGNV